MTVSRPLAVARALVVAAVVGASVAACASSPSPSGQSHTGSYVALGDSYTANSYHGPGATGNGCDQSGANQPHTVQARMGYASFIDASCDGATTNDILTNGNGDQAQIYYVNSATKLVTLSIGGNDIGFSDIVKNCTVKYLTFGGCKADYVVNGVDSVSQKITATAPKVATVLSQVTAKAPGAKVFVYGYPTLVPMSGTSGCVGLTLASGDIPWVRDRQAQLNNMLKAAAAAAGATYIDVYGPSNGHDPCAGDNWVARVVDLPPLHPSKSGMTNLSNIVANAVDNAIA